VSSRVSSPASHRHIPLRLLAAQLPRLNARWRERYPVLLESAAEASPLNRYDVLLAGPAECLTLDAHGRLTGPAGDARGFLAALDRWWSAERQRERIETPFAGGWFLYLGYELAAEVEPTLALTTGTRPKALAWPRPSLTPTPLTDRLSARIRALEPRLTVQGKCRLYCHHGKRVDYIPIVRMGQVRLR